MTGDFEKLGTLPRLSGVSLSDSEQGVRRTGNDGGYYVEADLKRPLKLDLQKIGSNIPDGGSYKTTGSDGTNQVILTYKDEGGHQTLLLRCYVNEQGEVYRVGSARPPVDIATNLSAAMGAKVFDEFKETIPESSKLSLEYSERDRQHSEARAQRNAANNKLISDLNQLPKASDHALPLSPDNTRGVGQAEILEVRGSDRQHILASFGAGPCVIIAAYSPSLGKVVMAHVDASTRLDNVKQQFDRRLDGASDIQLHFAGGDSSSRQQAGDLAEIFTNDNRYSVKSAEIVRSSGSASLAIDAKTGQVSAGVVPTQVDAGIDFDMRMKFVLFRQPNSPLNSVPEKAFKHPEKDRLPPETSEPQRSLNR